MTRVGFGAVWLVLGLLIPVQAAASGFANAPGTVWAKVSYLTWTADEEFAGPFDRDPLSGVELGDRIPFDRDQGGELETRSVNLDLRVTPLERLTLGLSMPVFQEVMFTNTAGVASTQGTGDVLTFIGYQLNAPDGPLGVTTRLYVKIPTTEPEAELESVPLSEGQVDVALEQETTWAPLDRLHVTGRALLRLRDEFEDTEGGRIFKPGDEFEVGLEVGGAPVDGVWLKGGYAGLWSTGAEDRSNVAGTVTIGSRKIVQSLSAGAYLSVGRWVAPGSWWLSGLALDGWVAHPVAGQDYPAGLTWSVGVAHEVRWGAR